jgi:F0F1-type ATP synthase assembly protein I
MMDSREKPPRDSTPPSDEPSPWALAGLGTQFFASILLFVWVGNWLDRRLDTAPLFLLGGVLLGGGGGFYASYRRLTRLSDAPSSDHDSTPNT